MVPVPLKALRWGDIDLKRRELSISKSHYLDEEASTKIAGSEREIRLLPEVAAVLNSIKPLHVMEDTHDFLNQEGCSINFHTWRAKIWYRALRAKGMTERKPYSMRHTFISVGLTNVVSIKWLADYCGTSVAMIEKHYGKYIRNEADEQLQRLKTVTLTVTPRTRRL